MTANPVHELRKRAGLTQTGLAQRAGTSQPTIAAYESGAKAPNLRTLARMAESAGLELVIDYVRPLTREDRRSIALHRAIAAKLVADPDGVRHLARQNLRLMSEQHPYARRLFRRWRALLDLPTRELADLLGDPREWMRELRQVTPFAGTLTAPERADVYLQFRDSDRQFRDSERGVA